MWSDEALLEQCKSLIETKTGWGSSATWANRDFVELSEKIYAETQVSLSASTLKRIWGRVRYDSVPHPATLDALAHFAGFEHWRALKTHFAKAQTTASDNGPPMPAIPATHHHSLFGKIGKKWRIPAALLGTLALLTALSLVRWSFLRPTPAPAAAFSFTSHPVANGVPNSVVFKYDATAARPGDSIFIQQSWDKRKRIKVSREGHEHTAIYYYPGFYKAKLVVNGKTVCEQDVFIPTDGWVALIERKPTPLYLSRQEFEQDSILSVSPETVATHHLPLQPEAPSVNFFNVRDFNGLQSDCFFFETEIRNDFSEGSAVCQFSEIILLFQHDVWVIPLSAPGCVAELNLHLGRKDFKATYTDLSGFGSDLRQWTRVRCEAQGRQIVVRVNDKQAYALTSEAPVAKIIGVRYRFDGGGSVRGQQWGKMP